MNRNGFFRKAALGGGLLGNSAINQDKAWAYRVDDNDVVVVREQPGKPHKGKVFLAVQAHLDDIPYYAGGTCAKLINEGYTGYLLRTSNDEKCGPGTQSQNIKSNEEENFKMAKALGFTDVYDFYYRNHRMNNISTQEFRARVVFLIRMLKVDTVMSFNPWGHGEENPDHWVTGQVLEEACWMSGMGQDYPEQIACGFPAHSVRERYYYSARPGQPYNRVFDIAGTIEQKIQSIAECKSQGGGANGSRLRAKLAREGKKLAILGNDDETADREYVRHFLIDEYRELGKKHGLEYAETFYYVDQRSHGKSKVDTFIEKNTEKL